MIETVALTGSTNADMMVRADAGAPEGLWLRAEQQDGGRGRLGRQWLSPVGNLYCSTLVRLRPDDPPAHLLAFVTALAVHDTVLHILPGCGARLKWPNDVHVEGAKLAGILLERRGDAVVVGIGMNVALAPDVPGRSVTSLRDLGAMTQIDAQAVVELLADHFAARLAQWRSVASATLLDVWCAAAHKPGDAMAVQRGPGDRIEGVFEGLAHDGALRLRLSDGRIETISAGDVDLVG
ncbi:BirA family biotin operon repressor/biotin-[acetyl-CoA-carboxylase] ligase [Blastomonas natatoria]|uniref:biotin--[biotin carboxyl-carrier protein] ligase n=1 Tax=Blastomonas natatoria TaxID=34015 RepID=A0A2V3V6V9_9SPHN|nr:biotin--[acetyl-CoA-carboxylase] ligase [Blastomonas natatoria]PXW75895.1 BirA family biotin operon repressor/biotin-[acetyl-CoA-carboxylase] ligase [Blastomonas natatoria]